MGTEEEWWLESMSKYDDVGRQMNLLVEIIKELNRYGKDLYEVQRVLTRRGEVNLNNFVLAAHEFTYFRKPGPSYVDRYLVLEGYDWHLSRREEGPRWWQYCDIPYKEPQLPYGVDLRDVQRR